MLFYTGILNTHLNTGLNASLNTRLNTSKHNHTYFKSLPNWIKYIMKKILTIAGSDTSGGAGIQADLRTFAKHNLFGMSALTVIVTMDPNNGWAHSVFPIELSTIEHQIDTALIGVGADTIKTGMLPTPEIIALVASRLDAYIGKLPIVIDPVMVCKGDKPLFPEHADAIRVNLIKYATVATPNLFEAAQLAQMPVLTSLEDAKNAAVKIHQAGAKNVVIKLVGTLCSPQTSADLYFDGENFSILEGKLINTSHTHGVGCTFASHIAANLCKGLDPKTSCLNAKDAVSKGLMHHFSLNEYVGTLDFEKSFE
ncbi:hydroxymethylpyrimidine/phosphomethylpyrimidine kinase [Gammaproteobacteria bacterium]|nr:hydroxymethylpyrimidine/phosphomethylpyrimidine kinase [Gammaproteobacteria bacterium]